MKKIMVISAAVVACVMMVSCGYRTSPTESFVNDYLTSCEGVISVTSWDDTNYVIAGRSVQVVNSMVEVENKYEYHNTMRYVVAKTNGEFVIVKNWDEAVEVATTDSIEFAQRGKLIDSL